MAQCVAKSKRSGERCKGQAVTGALVCRMHGGAAPQVKQGAVRRLAIAEAQRLVATDGSDMSPLDYLVDSLRRAFQWMRVWGVMVADLDDHADLQSRERDALRGALHYEHAERNQQGEILTVTTSETLLGFNFRGEASIHPFVEQYERAMERVAKFAKLAIDAGIDEARLQLEASQVEVAVRAFEAMLTELGLNSDQKQEARQTYVRHLQAVN